MASAKIFLEIVKYQPEGKISLIKTFENSQKNYKIILNNNFISFILNRTRNGLYYKSR